MTARARIIAVSVALVTVALVASAAVGLSSLGSPVGSTDGVGGAASAETTDVAASGPPPLSRSALPERTPENGTYRTIVVFRNDDVQGGYRMETMRAVDEVFVKESVPVTLGVIPRIGERNITDDAATCSYLAGLKRTHPELFEVALHGYTHASVTDFHGGSEFGGLPASAQAERIERGIAVMEECTGLAPRTFVPPFNTYDANTTAALVARNVTAVSGGGWFTAEYYGTERPFANGGAVHLPSTHAFTANWTTGEFRSQDRMREGFDQAYENGSMYVQMLHYPSFNTTAKRDRLRSLIRYMKDHEGVAFMTVGEFDRAVRAGSLERTQNGWRYGAVETNRSRDANALVTDARSPGTNASGSGSRGDGR